MPHYRFNEFFIGGTKVLAVWTSRGWLDIQCHAVSRVGEFWALKLAREAGRKD